MVRSMIYLAAVAAMALAMTAGDADAGEFWRRMGVDHSAGYHAASVGYAGAVSTYGCCCDPTCDDEWLQRWINIHDWRCACRHPAQPMCHQCWRQPCCPTPCCPTTCCPAPPACCGGEGKAYGAEMMMPPGPYELGRRPMMYGRY